MSERPARRGFASRPADPDQWIRAAGASPRNDSATGYTARLTIDVTPDQRGVTVADMLRDLLAREFPPAEGERP